MEIFTVKNMTFTYAGAQNPVLKDVNLTVKRGELITICGRSGSGKSTLLKNLKPALAPCGEMDGKILFCGTPVKELSHHVQSSRIGYVLQNPDNQIVTDKVWHELAFGLESLGVKSETIRLRVAEMASYFGIQTWFHKEVKELSGGQKQLLNLASVMAMQPDVLILDEPTSQLDPIAAEDFLETIRKINRDLGTTVVITEHRLESVIPMSDRVIVLDEGFVLADDTPTNVGVVLAEKNHTMFRGMPTPLQVYGSIYQEGIGTQLACPVDVREGRGWLTEIFADKEIKIKELPEEEQEHSSETAVEMKDVWFRYTGNGEDIIKDMFLEVKKGELLCLTGGNGTGKTTAVNVIGGISKPYRGKVRTYGKTGILPQNPQTIFVEKTLNRDLLEIFEDCQFDEAEKDRRIREITEILEIDSLLDMHPYDLSGGEQQRAALAKVLLLEPQILLLDEPTKGLDWGFRLKLAEILKKLKNKGITIIMVSHDIEFCSRYADRCAMFFDGKVTAYGTPREFFSGNSFYTTAANRMSRHLFRNAVNADDLTELIKANFTETPGGKGSGPQPAENSAILQTDKIRKKVPVMAEAGDRFDGNILQSETHMQEKHRKVNVMAVDIITIVLAAATILVGFYIFGNQKYFIVSMLLAVYALIPFFTRFERRAPKAREIVILAVMITAGVAGRAAFFMVPNFKPLLAIVIISGVALGRHAGFLVGAMSAFVSNFLFGQGPWTTWQMLAMALIGYLAGVFFGRHAENLKILPVTVFGGLSAFFIYGAITDLWTIMMMTSEPSLATAITVYTAAIPFNLIHAAATVIFLLLLAKPITEKLNRVKIKYGMNVYEK